MNETHRELEQLRDRVIELLKTEKRAIHTGEIAERLRVLTHQGHGAMRAFRKAKARRRQAPTP